MQNLTRKLFRGAFAALMAGALGFGTMQALATPALAAATERCTSEMNEGCNDSCVADGFTWGRCVVDRNLGVTVCECY